ncbi:MAG: type II secretion system protein [Alphaproteobacteria bacterium]|nr:type II secretion system protein [Alphaproteobacteria bacterium]MBP3687724.1 type II secretion system protein [Alphaproteobacteria bacterium]
MKLFLTTERGRSMIEMLGVLAIVGILSVGGIAGYSKAMRKYKYMKLAEELNLFIISSQPYLKDLFRTYNNNTNYSAVPSSIFTDLNLFPNTWSPIASTHTVNDSTGQRLALFFRSSKSFTIDYVFNDSNHKGRLLSKDEIMRCQYILQYVVIPNADILLRAYMTSLSNKQYYGSHHCTGERLCLSNLTLNDIEQMCSACITDEKSCVIALDIIY